MGGFLGIALATLGPSLCAQEPPPAVATTNGKSGQGPNPVVAAIQESNPKTPTELIEAINQLIAFQEVGLANDYAATLGKLDLQVKDMKELGDRLDSVSLLRIINNRQLDKKGREQCQRILATLAVRSNNPERLADLANQATSDDPAQRRHAITDLRVAGPLAVGPLAAILADPERQNVHPRAVFALYQMGNQTIAPLLAVLESEDEQLRANILQALGQLKASPAVHDILAAATSADGPPQIAGRSAASRVIGKLPPVEKIKKRIAAAVHDYLTGRIHLPTDGDGQSTLWTWDDKTHVLASQQVEKSVLAASTAYRIAHALWRIDPDDPQSQQMEAVVRLQRDKLYGGLHNPLGSKTKMFLHQRVGRKSQTTGKSTASFGDFSEAIFEEALRRGYVPAAIAAAENLEQVAANDDRLAQLIARRAPQAHPLVEAVGHPNRRLRFAATRALLQMNPDLPYVGASRVNEALRFFASVDGQPHILLADSRSQRRHRIASFLKNIGYETDTYKTGSAAFLAATKNSETVAAFLSFTINPRSIQEVLHELRTDPRTASLPVALIVEPENRVRAEHFAEDDPLTLVFFSPRDEETAKIQVAQLIATAGSNFIAQQERLQQAAEAIDQIAKFSKIQSDIYDLTGFDRVLKKNLYVPSLSKSASQALGNIGSAFAQLALVDAASQTHLPTETRAAAASAFARSAKKHGIGLTLEQIQRQAERYDQSAESSPENEAILWRILDAIQNSQNKK